MRKFGYFLYSEIEDNFLQESQYLDNVRCCPILYDRYTHADDNYESLNIIFEQSKPGDVLILRSLDHIALSMKQLSYNIIRLQKHKLHLLVLEQESIHTKKHGMDKVYTFILNFCNINFDFLSNNSLKRDRSFLEKMSYRGWTREKINKAEKCYQMHNKGISKTEISHLMSTSYNVVTKYIKLCGSDEIKIIESQVTMKENLVRRPNGSPPGLSAKNKIKAREMKRLISKNISPKIIQETLGLSKATFYRYKKLDDTDLVL